MNPTDDNEAQAGAESGGWSQADFESALPLYVGGDLDPTDAAFVEAWIARHPADRAQLDAARASRRILQEHGERERARPTPDLWPSVREELARTGALGTGLRTFEARAVDGSGQEPTGRVVGGTRWFHRPGFAAAAAVLLAVTVGTLLVRTGAPAESVPAERPEAFTGRPAAVRLVGTQRSTPAVAPATAARTRNAVVIRRPAFVPLRPASRTEPHLIDGASEVPLWQRADDLPRLVAPLPGSGVELTNDGK
ncbi:MAG: hypothetical protein AAGA20_22240 [Planctomycetota bacterium]